MDLDDAAAPRAPPPQLMVVPAVAHRGEQADDRHQPRDQEPQDERASLDPPDDAPAKPKNTQMMT